MYPLSIIHKYQEESKQLQLIINQFCRNFSPACIKYYMAKGILINRCCFPSVLEHCMLVYCKNSQIGLTLELALF